MNITELARRLKIPTQQLKDELPKLGFDVGRRAIKVDDAVAEKVVKLWQDKQQHIRESQYVVVERKLGEDAASTPRTRSVALPPQLTVREFAALLGLPVTTVVGELFKNGIMAAMNERIDFETATIIAQDLGYSTTVAEDNKHEVVEETQALALGELLKESDVSTLKPRPPVVVVMGHVDHGKTTLLDAIRSTNVAAGESGAITQHIGAYQVVEKGRAITFLDTPGHEAFSAMRSRGGRLADVAIIVVAADDGLQPQTLEAIEIAQREKLSFLFAINKVDRENADVERVKKALAELNLLPEDWGGKTICVPISAKQKQGIPELLDMVLLLADLAKLEANPARAAVGTIIEAHLDKGEGPVATALVQTGTLRPGDFFIAGEVAGKVRSMKDYLGKTVSAATPATPVRVLGLKQVPRAGDVFHVVEDEKLMREAFRHAPKYQRSVPEAAPVVAPQEGETVSETPAIASLNLVLKTDVLGSREALLVSLKELAAKGVQAKVVRAGLGSVTETDVTQAEASHAIVLGFNVPIMPAVTELARNRKVFVGTYKVIYDLLDEVKRQLNLMLKPELVRNQIGSAIVLKVFRRGKRDMIIGCRVAEGVIKPKTKVRVVRGTQAIAELELTEVRIGKEAVGEVAEGGECGVLITGNPVIEERDMLEVYHEEIRQRTIS